MPLYRDLYVVTPAESYTLMIQVFGSIPTIDPV